MKKDRNCTMNNFPGYVLPVMPGMPNITMSPGYNTYPNNNDNFDDELNRINNRINMLERRIAALEGNGYNNYSSSSYQML